MMIIIIIITVTGRPWKNPLNWIPAPAPAPSRDYGKKEEKEEEENRPPASQPSRIHRKIRPRRRKRANHQQHLPGANGNSPGIDLRPRWMKRTPQKHSLLPKHPQHPRPAANENSSRVNLQDQADPGRLYKQASPSRVKESMKRSRRDYFSGSSLSFSSKRPLQDYFSGPSSHSRACKGRDTELALQPQAHRGHTQAGPQGGAISLPQRGCHSVSHHPQTPPSAAHSDSVIEVGLEPPAAALTSHIPHEALPPVILEIPSGSPELEEELPESNQCPDTSGKWFRPPTRSPQGSSSASPPSPCRPKKHFSSLGRWCE